MSLDLSRALLVVRDLDPGTGAPVCPPTWLCVPVAPLWWRLWPGGDSLPSDPSCLVHRANVDPGGTRGLFAVLGPPAVLSTIEAAADLALPAREAWRRRAEPGVLLYLRSWPTFRCQGVERATDENGDPIVVPFDGVRRLLDEGGRLPDYTVEPLPWDLAADGSLTTQALARYRVTGVDRPALETTLAGLGCHARFEDQEDPGA